MNKEELYQYIKKQHPNICQMSCYKDGKEMFSGEWNDYKKTDSCHVMSVTKSVVALLVGIAIDNDLIKSIDQPVLDFFPDYKIKKNEKTIQKVTIKHLLTMKAPYKYKFEPWSKVCSSDDWTLAALDFLGGRKGITEEFKYSTLGIHILTGIISKTSGLKVVEFANKFIFEPIGVQKHSNYYAETIREHRAFIMNKKARENLWFCDPQEIGTAGYGLCFSATDLAKIGLLCLNNGLFNGTQIVSSHWINEITTPTHKCGKHFGNMSYGYLWWIVDEERHVYAAIGDSGNIIYVNTSLNVVVAITSYFKPRVFDRIELIQSYIEPFLFSSTANNVVSK